jgi:uncharacterized protein involved in response to NO
VDDMENDLRKTGVKRWRIKVMGRTEWRKKHEVAKVLQQLQSHVVAVVVVVVVVVVVTVARREVFVSVSAFKPKVKNVSPRAWTEPIAVLLLLLSSSSSSSSSSSLLLLLLLFMGTSNVQTVGIFRMPL